MLKPFRFLRGFYFVQSLTLHFISNQTSKLYYEKVCQFSPIDL